MTDTPISQTVALKVHTLIEQNRVLLVNGYEDRAALVIGDSGCYVVKAFPDGVRCVCPAGISGQCSHILAAMAVWASALDDPFSGVAS